MGLMEGRFCVDFAFKHADRSVRIHLKGTNYAKQVCHWRLFLTFCIWKPNFETDFDLSIMYFICHHFWLCWYNPRSGELWTQKLKSHLVRTQSLHILPLKPGVSQYIAIHATLTARDFSTLLISTLPVHSPAFFQTSPDFSCVGYG